MENGKIAKKNENYYVGLDIGTDSVGYAVTDEEYNLCRFKGKHMWGATLFEGAQLSEERRGFRTARRRLARRKQRIQLLRELFAREIGKIDQDFFIRLDGSYKHSDDRTSAMRLFPTRKEQQEYGKKYPTIHHLIVDLMTSNEFRDPRLVYIACSWLVSHRGHFLNEVNKDNISAVTSFSAVYNKFVEFLTRDEKPLPWNDRPNLMEEIEKVLKAKENISQKGKNLGKVLYASGKVPKEISEECPYNMDLLLKLLCGSSVDLKNLFGNEEYGELATKSVALSAEDETLVAVMQSLNEEDGELIAVSKGIYDWSVLVNVLNGKESISEGKIDVYNQHKKDLRFLKDFIRNHCKEKFNEIFRQEGKSNYVAYSYNVKSIGEANSVEKKANKEDFSKYIKSVVASVTPYESEKSDYDDMIVRLERQEFLPKQVDGNNRTIPYQLYWDELNKILGKAEKHLSFLSEKDEDGISATEKILSIFEFRIPYYVGPLKENPNNNEKVNHWMKRKAEGKIYPWNFEKKVDLDESEEAFIRRMTNKCTYLPGEDVLPKDSLLYSAFTVLNTINNWRINGEPLDFELRKGIYEGLFMKKSRVTLKDVKNFLRSNGFPEDVEVSGFQDKSDKSADANVSLRSRLFFDRFLKDNVFSPKEVEQIISRAAYSEDKVRFKKWLSENFPSLKEQEKTAIASQRFKGFGRLSRKLLYGIKSIDKEKSDGREYTVIEAMWFIGLNLMQILADNGRFTFKEQIEAITREYYKGNSCSLTDRLGKRYVSNRVKRPIIRTLDVLSDIIKAKKVPPKMIFIEMARDVTDGEKKKLTTSRKKQLENLYDKIKNDIENHYKEDFDTVHKKLKETNPDQFRIRNVYLYFMQMGKCLYTGKSIDLNDVISGNGNWNRDHIYPQSRVMDDSILNNLVLVESVENAEKRDSIVPEDIRKKMTPFWTYLRSKGLMTDEKYKRLTRSHDFTPEETFGFANRQLVETRQATKVLAEFLQDAYPETKIVFVKAELTSRLRQECDLPKSRLINDLHHAKDAYLNIVMGNIWYHKFTRQHYFNNNKWDEKNVKVKYILSNEVLCEDRVIWKGVEDREKICRNVRKNTAHVTRYSFCRKGGFFDQMPVKAKTGLVPLKKDRPTEIYGGYNKSTATFFVLVRFQTDKKRDIIFMPVELLFSKKFLEDETFAHEYAKNTIEGIVGKKVLSTEFLLNKRPLKVQTMLSLDGFPVLVTGKADSGKRLLITTFTNFQTDWELERYICSLETFNKKRTAENLSPSKKEEDVITKEKNLQLYDRYTRKFASHPYNKRPNNPIKILEGGKEKFENLEKIEDQVEVLLQIQGLFGRIRTGDLTKIGGSKLTGNTLLPSRLSNWEYNDVRIIDQSASGIYETYSENLLDLL